MLARVERMSLRERRWRWCVRRGRCRREWWCDVAFGGHDCGDRDEKGIVQAKSRGLTRVSARSVADTTVVGYLTAQVDPVCPVSSP
jgi:hypothetical protein